MQRAGAEAWGRRLERASQAIYLCLGESEHPHLRCGAPIGLERALRLIQLVGEVIVVVVVAAAAAVAGGPERAGERSWAVTVG